MLHLIPFILHLLQKGSHVDMGRCPPGNSTNHGALQELQDLVAANDEIQPVVLKEPFRHIWTCRSHTEN